MSQDTNAPPSPENGAPPVILQVLPALDTGGVERGTIDVAAAIAQRGWTPLVASAGGRMVRELDRLGVKHITLPLDSKNPWVIGSNRDRLAALIADYKVDIVHARSRAPAWSARAAAERTGAHFVTTYHGTYNAGPFGIKTRYNRIMARGETVIAISEFIARHIQDMHHTDPARIVVVPRGIDFTTFDPTRVSAERIIALAQRWRLPDGYKVIMLPGRLTRWKGQSVLIEALAHLERRDVRCLLVGSDQGRSHYSDALKDLIRKKGLVDVVHIVGDTADMAAAYMLTDVVVSASTDPEAFGRVVVEGQAMGRPVIATDNGAAKETVDIGHTGLLVPPGDPVALARALEVILGLSEEERHKVAGDARAFVAERFSKERMCASTLEVYAALLARAEMAEPSV